MANNKGFQEKMKSFFRGFNKGTNVPRTRSEEYLTLTEELENELKPESSLANRLKAAKEICEVARVRKLESYTVEKLWTLLEDLLKPDVNRDTRHTIIKLFTHVCSFQEERQGYLRAKFFEFIRQHNVDDDAVEKFEFLKALTDSGRDVAYFEEKIGQLLLLWMGSGILQKNIKTGDFMCFLNNFIKYNQSFIDQEILVGMIENVCFMACTTQDKSDVLECLQVLETVLAYCSLPPSSLRTFLATLCRTVNSEALCQASWKTVRNLLGTHLGHSALLTMCQFMETGEKTDDYAVIRGAVFYVGVSLWGGKVVRSLKYSPATILSSFAAALERKHIFVSYEVILRLQDLVKCNGDALPAITWDPILEIMETVVDNLQIPEWQSDASNLKKLVRVINETLDSVESLVETGGFSGALHKFYDVVESASEFRSESSMIKLLAYKHKTNLQRIHANWMNHAIMFAEKHTREETRPNLKVAAMKIIHEVALAQIDTHHEELVDKIVLHYFRNLDTEPSILVREAGVQFLVEFLMEGPLVKKSSEMLGILEKIIHRPYEVNSKEALHESDVLDITAAVNGVIQLFQRKIYQYPPVLGIACYKILVRHLSNHYRRPGVLDLCWSIRHNIFKCFFAIRANSLYHLGFPDSVTGIKTLSNGIRFSPYLCVDHRDGEKPEVSHKSESITPLHEGGQMQPLSSASSLSTSVASSNSTTVLGSSNLSLQSNTSTPSVNGTLGTSSSSGVGTASNSTASAPTAPTTFSISLKLACELVVRSLKCEKDFHILELTLKEIPYVLENKALILSRHGNDIDYMANALCSMITDKSINFESLRNSPPQLSRSDLQAYVFPILTSLVSYHVHLEPPVQLKIVKCLEQGLVTKCSRICILALSICTLEMKDTMHKLLPEVLLALSKITARRNIAIPVLEFLSTLIHLPRVFASFVQDQYMSIFAIALPYTNPSKFNHYTVSLAHHVIAMWFLKCRLSFRRGFVSYIMKGLENNVWAPFEEETRRTDRELQNEDSANRKRSSSLTDQTYKRRERPISGHTNANQLGPAHRPGLDPKPAIDKATMTFHQELTETCVDLMARYAFADCSALPTRFTSSNALLAGGDSKTWIVENKIITITTSGCTQKALKDGFCDKCWLQCKKSFDFSPSSDGPDWDGSGERSPVGYGESSFSQQRRRHRSAFAGISQSKLASLGQTEDSKTKDDLHLESKASISEIDEKGRYSMYADHKGKQETSYCLCSCQGWAELYIRRPTGNTSWMMRIQNQLVNFSNFEWPMKELACMYVTVANSTGLRQIQLQQQQESSAAASIKNSPIHHSNSNIRSSLSNLSGSQTGINSTSGRQSEQSSYQSPSSPSSPHAPGSPIDESHPDYGRRNPVKRSNSSPEMGSSFKAFYLAHQRNIEEQEEDEVCGILSEEVQKLASGSLQLENEKNDSSGGTASDGTDHHVEKEPKIKPTSPFQCYESIPEEISSSGQENERSEPEQQPFIRERLSTISVMTPARRNTGLPLRRMVSVESTMNRVNPFQSQPIMSSAPANEVGARAGISPSFVFLQLCSQGMFGSSSKPIHIPPGDQTQRSLRVLDSIPPYETHKIGVVYVGANQESQEALILRNQYGSSRYREFLQGLGKLIRLEQVDPQKTFLGGLSRDGTDGEFTYIWQDDVMQVIFHVATLMPNTTSDPNGTNKKRHIGNDFVAIIYNDSGKEYDISTLKCQFLYACVVIEPLDHKTNRVTVKAKSDLVDQIGHAEPKIVSDQNLPIMARQWALHSNLASRIFQSAKTPDPYASNWLERLRQIKRLRAKVAQDNKKPTGNADDQLDRNGSSSARKTFIVEDFTEFMCP